MDTPLSFTHLTDQELLEETSRLARYEREATVPLIASLMELDQRRLYLGAGCSSLFTYCTGVLHLSEHAAYGRIAAARAAREFPGILGLLSGGAITLTAVRLLAPHLTTENHEEVLAAARHKSKVDIEHIVARLSPRPSVAATVRKLPEPRMLSGSGSPEIVDSSGDAVPVAVSPPPKSAPAEIKPLAPERYKVQFTIGRETHEKLRRAQDLLRHTVPNGDPAVVFDRALTLLLAELERTKFARAHAPRAAAPTTGKNSRHIPAAVKRAVWARDGARCAFVGTTGRCAETGFLEFHHAVPFAAGGEATPENVRLLCRAHNLYEAEEFFEPRELPIMREDRSTFGGP